jgi:hypothetical protein
MKRKEVASYDNLFEILGYWLLFNLKQFYLFDFIALLQLHKIHTGLQILSDTKCLLACEIAFCF